MKLISRRQKANPDGMMSLVDHLRELRYRLLFCLAAIGAMTIIGYIWYSHSFVISLPNFYHVIPSTGELLSKPYCDIPSPPRAQITADGSCKLLSSTPFDQFFLRLKVAMATGVVLACPWWFYHLWRFIAPGLKKNEKKYTSFFVITSASLFIIGAIVAYIVLPEAFKFLLRVGDNIQVTALQGDKYFSFVINLLIIFGVSFELPIVVLALNFVRVLPAKILVRFQRGIIFTFFVFAAIVTPGQDPFSMLALAGSLTVLFECAVLGCVVHDKILYRKEEKKARDNYEHLEDNQASPEESIRASEILPFQDDTEIAEIFSENNFSLDFIDRDDEEENAISENEESDNAGGFRNRSRLSSRAYSETISDSGVTETIVIHDDPPPEDLSQ